MKKCKYKVLWFVCLFVLCGCSFAQKKLIPTNNNGGYSITVIDGDQKINSDEVTISGKVIDRETGKLIEGGLFVFGCRIILPSSKGNFSFKVKRAGYDPVALSVALVSHRSVETRPIDLKNASEIKIDFYVVKDTSPDYDCVGSYMSNKRQEELNKLE